MATIKSFSDLQQSKKLAEILPLESADMHYRYDNDFHELESIPTITEEDDHFILFPKDVRCWSLAALLNVLPDELEDNHFLTLDKEGNEYYCCYEDGNCNSFYHTFADNPIDACYELILKLHESNLL